MQFQLRALAVFVLAMCCSASPSVWAAKVQVDWAKPTGSKGTSAKYGLNLFKVYNPAVSQQNPAYKRELSRMSPGYMRVHSWNMMGNSASGDGWIADGDKATYRWDEGKIVEALKGVIPASAKGMMNIPAWPAFLGGSDKPLAQANTAAFAAFCAQLVQIVNIKGKHGIKYWEVTNERDDVYNGQGAALANVVIEAARAMKKVDPTILVGGPAFIQPWHAIVGDFLTASVGEIDFVSYHTYATGDANAPLQGLFDHASGLGAIGTYMRGEIAKRTSRKLEIFHNEYNISYAPPDERMSSVEGAVFDALALVGFANNADITGSAAWNEADGWYGKLDGDMKPKPASYVFELFNRWALGEVMTSTSDAPKAIVPVAVSSTGGKSLFIINRTNTATSVDVAGFDDRKSQASQVTKDGLAQISVPTSGALMVPALSVTVVVSGAGASNVGGQGGPGSGGSSGAGGASGAGGKPAAGGAAGMGGQRAVGGSGGTTTNSGGSTSGGTTSNQGGATEGEGEAEGEGGASGDDPDEPASKSASAGCSVAVGADVGAWALIPALLWLSLRRRRRG